MWRPESKQSVIIQQVMLRILPKYDSPPLKLNKTHHQQTVHDVSAPMTSYTLENQNFEQGRPYIKNTLQL